jgi:ABC-type uncharacterized transport system ATPase subunit
LRWRAIVMDPEVLVYGDPFVGLDPISMGLLCDSFSANDVPCLTGIVDSHDVHEILTVADGIVLLSGGMLSHDVCRSNCNPIYRRSCGNSLEALPTVRCRFISRPLMTSASLSRGKHN